MTVDTQAPATDVLRRLGIEDHNQGAFCGSWLDTSGTPLESRNPATGEVLASVHTVGEGDYERIAATAVEAFDAWRRWTAPARGEVVRQLGNELRKHK